MSANAYYAGSIDRNDFNEEGDDKGFIIAAFEGRTPKVDVDMPERHVIETFEVLRI